MKKTRDVIWVLLPFLLFGCKEESGTPFENRLCDREWNYVSEKIMSGKNGTEAPMEIYSLGTLEFKHDGKGTWERKGVDDVNFEWKAIGDSAIRLDMIFYGATEGVKRTYNILQDEDGLQTWVRRETKVIDIDEQVIFTNVIELQR